MRDRSKDILKAHLRSALMMAKNLTVCDKTDLELIDIVADQLLLRGVVVPPCMVGDSIYKVVKPKNSNVSDGWIVEQKVAGFHLGDIPRLRGDKRREYFIIFHEPTRYISHIPFDKLGKTVFLTKEEAEKALRGEGE